ncbi:MAG: D-alanyl-D-alanine carboxypeptidase [Firmicutes bacterium]|nr:D-alanyl-D-alanine carboxypeptidase [Bacillota bacterium]
MVRGTAIRTLLTLVLLATTVLGLTPGAVPGVRTGLALAAAASAASAAPSPPPAPPLPFDIPARSGILIDATTGQVLWSKNAHEKLPPASITKIMTMLLTVEAVDRGQAKWSDRVTTSLHAYDMGGSQVYLQPGEVLTLGQMMDAVAIESANDATVAVAEFLAGSEEAFVAAMNQRARELGMTDTRFYNSTGLPAEPGQPDNVTSAADVAKMARALVSHPSIFQFIAREKAIIPTGPKRAKPFVMYNRNGLLFSYPGADGIKTGYTDAAGYCLAGTAKQDGRRLIAVVMHAASEAARVEQTARLLDYGFRSFTPKTVARKGQVVGKVPLPSGARAEVDAVAAAPAYILVPRWSRGSVRSSLTWRKGLDAPVRKGQVVGGLVVRQGNQFSVTVPVVAAQSVSRAGGLTLFFRWLWHSIVHIVTFGRV